MLFGIIVCTFLLYIAGANTVNISSISVCCGNHLSQWQIIIQASKSLNIDIMWKVHKRTQQGVSAKLESYIYKVHMVHATNNYICPYIHATTSCPPHFLLKATILSLCTLISSSRFFHHVLGL